MKDPISFPVLCLPQGPSPSPGAWRDEGGLLHCRFWGVVDLITDARRAPVLMEMAPGESKTVRKWWRSTVARLILKKQCTAFLWTSLFVAGLAGDELMPWEEHLKPNCYQLFLCFVVFLVWKGWFIKFGCTEGECWETVLMGLDCHLIGFSRMMSGIFGFTLSWQESIWNQISVGGKTLFHG